MEESPAVTNWHRGTVDSHLLFRITMAAISSVIRTAEAGALSTRTPSTLSEDRAVQTKSIVPDGISPRLTSEVRQFAHRPQLKERARHLRIVRR